MTLRLVFIPGQEVGVVQINNKRREKEREREGEKGREGYDEDHNMKTFKCYKATYKVNYRAVSAKGTQNRTQKYNCLRWARFSHKIFMF